MGRYCISDAERAGCNFRFRVMILVVDGVQIGHATMHIQVLYDITIIRRLIELTSLDNPVFHNENATDFLQKLTERKLSGCFASPCLQKVRIILNGGVENPQRENLCPQNILAHNTFPNNIIDFLIPVNKIYGVSDITHWRVQAHRPFLFD